MCFLCKAGNLAFGSFFQKLIFFILNIILKKKIFRNSFVSFLVSVVYTVSKGNGHVMMTLKLTYRQVTN